MTALRVALGFLTVLPAGPRTLPSELAPARTYFPLVGLLLGGALVGLDLVLRLAFPPLAVGALLVAALLALTRMLHIEGFMDSCDGLFGGHTRERRLEIMRDPHSGSFAVVGVAALLLVKWSLVATLPAPGRLAALALFPCLGRWAMVVAMAAFPYARPEGLGAPFQRGRRPVQVVVALASAIAAAIVLGGLAGAGLFAVATAVAWMASRWAAGLLGGLTGDTYGAVNELAEVAVLATASAAAGLWPGSLAMAPLLRGAL